MVGERHRIELTHRVVAAQHAIEPDVGVFLKLDPSDELRAGRNKIPARVRQAREAAALARQYRLPAISIYRPFAADGGLMSYGPDSTEIFRRSASYVDRILKGTPPAELPVQQPDKFEFAINLGTARALGLTVAPSLLALADDVIE